MILNKKNYAEQLLHLALTLSLLRVDPENYLDLQWETRLAGTGVGGWQLELRAAPLTDQSYVNRKALPSIIEDLARFDTQYNVPTHFDLQAYLLNIQNSNSTNQTSSTRASSPVPTQETPNSTTSVTIDLPTFETFDTEDIFLNTDPFADSTSVLEQNMADLNDFGEAPINTYALDVMPLKNEPPPMFEDLIRLPLEPNFFQNHVLDQELLQQAKLEQQQSEAAGSSHECCQSCDARMKQVQQVKVKEEPLGTGGDDECSRQECENGDAAAASATVVVKQEPADELVKIKKEEVEDDDDIEDKKVPLTAELTLEEMDLIEVLWKQDVDLGFTLTPPTVGTGVGGGTKGGADSSDDLEKLKVLLEIKNDDDKKKDDEKQPEENPWAGLSYTVDIETGEYVLNTTDGSEATLPPPLADLFLEEGLNLPELINDTIEETEEPAKKKTTAQEEEEESEVKRIERELESSADELCQGAAASVSASASGSTSTSPSVPAANENGLSGDSQEGTDGAAAVAAAGANSPDEPEASATASVASDDLEDILCDMMIQTSSSHFQHPRQPMQNYGHGMHGSLRQGGYHHHHHHHHHQSRVPLSRAVSMEQRWQDLANLMSFPAGMGVGMGVGDMPPAHPHPHYPPHYSYQAVVPQHGQYHSHAAVLQNASLADIGPTQPHYGPNLGSAVSTSMHLTNSTSETDAGATGYKIDHDLMYYSNTSSEMNHTDGFLNSILDDDLQLMDITVNEGMYTMRMLDHNATSSNSSVLGGAIGGSAAAVAAAAAAGLNGPAHLGGLMSGATSSASSGAMQTSLSGSTGVHGTNGATGGTTSGDRLDASSDSAVSSMGSERVPSLSDGEWGDGGSDSAQEYHNKYGGPFDYSYSSSNRLGDGTRQPPVAQKKHHMFAKRYFQEQNTTLPSLPTGTNPPSAGPTVDPQNQLNNPATASITRSHHHDVIHHNHTYTLPHNSGANPKPQTRDKRIRKSEEEHLTRDEKRARALQIPISVLDIINLPMDEFNERLSKYDLSETQLSLIRDIRRRGKNKVAAQNCRKRKLDQIVSLEGEVKDMKMRKERLLRDREIIQTERKRVRDKFSALYRHVFQNLRDAEGNPYSQEHWSLQQSADGTVVLVPRSVDRQQDLSASSHQQQQLGMAGGSGLSHSHHQQQHHLHLQQQHGNGPVSNGTNSGSSGPGGVSQHRPKE